jgi:hypothetical protein
MSFSVPNHFVCPLTQEVMIDPVMTANGQTYERAYIEEWFKQNATDPLTNTTIATALIPNRALRNAIEEFFAQLKVLETEGEQLLPAVPEETQSSVAAFQETDPAPTSPPLPMPQFPWLTDLLSATTQISPTDIDLIVQLLVGEGIDRPEVLSAIEESDFTAVYLGSLGIKKLGVQQHLLRIYKELRRCEK